ncbi:MAG: fimbrillin family protein, partial [Rikenellaceae bacterium]
MIHRIYWAILLLIMVVGCTKLDTKTLVNTYDSDAINFVTQTTKAISYDIDTMQSDADGFVVYGVEVDSPSWYDNLDGNRYIFDPSYQLWEWSSSDDPLWPVPFSQMNFYAYYPERALGFSPQASSPSTLTGDIVVESSILNQTDFLASSSGDILAKPSTGVLPLSFSHIMSKVSFSVLQDAGVLTVIRQLGIENIINTGTYDYINSSWQELSNRNLGSFDDYVGSSGPFAKYGVADQTDPIRIDGHYLMLIPQTGGDGDNQTPVWDGTLSDDDRGEGVPEGAYISMRYRTSANEDTEDLVGYAFRESCSN